MKRRNAKCFCLIGIGVLAFLTLFLYLIELLTSKPTFDILNFTINYAISLPFMLLLLLADYGLVVFINRSAKLAGNWVIRVIVEGVVTLLLAALLVIIGNIPFCDDLGQYIMSVAYRQSVIASVLMNIFTITTIEFFIQNRKNRQLTEENIQMQYRQLKSQINPHFLFNSLNALVSLINKNSDFAVAYTQKLSEVYRYVLTYDQQDTVRVKEELQFIRNYMEILRIRFGEGLSFRLAIRDEDLDRSIPPMSMQVLVENAVKHNAVSPSAPLLIQFHSNGHELIVTNKIIPRLRVDSGVGIGLENLKKKYRILADKPVRVEKDNTDFTVRLPLL